MTKEGSSALHQLTGSFFIDRWGVKLKAQDEESRMYFCVNQTVGFQGGIGTLVRSLLTKMVTVEKLEALPTGLFYKKRAKENDIAKFQEEAETKVNMHTNRLFPDDPQTAILAINLAQKAAQEIRCLFEESASPSALEIEQRLGEITSQLNELTKQARPI